MIYNSLRELTLTGDERDCKLISPPVTNIELLPVYISTITDTNSPSIHISYDNTLNTPTGLQGTLQSLIKIITIRIEVYLGDTNSAASGELVDRQAEFKDDIEYLLDPRNFIGSPFGYNRAYDEAVEIVDNALVDNHIILNPLSNASERIIPSIQILIDRLRTQRSLSEGAQIQDAGILEWIADQRTRESGHEVLAAVFQLELHYDTRSNGVIRRGQPEDCMDPCPPENNFEVR